MPWTTETLLKAILAAPDDCITISRMMDATGLRERQVTSAALRLRKGGFIIRNKAGCHHLTDAGRAAIEEGVRLRSGPKGPQQFGQRSRNPGLRQRVWNVLRMGKKVTMDDIVMLTVVGGERDPYCNVRKYVSALKRAGYVVVMANREATTRPGAGCQRLWLVSDTGPIAPVWRQSRASLFDPNTETETPFAEAA